MKFSNGVAIAILTCAAAWPITGHAAGTGGCESFAWPLKVEIDWMQSADSAAVASGATLAAPPAKAIALTLQPTDVVKFDVAPSGKPKGDAAKTFAGIVKFDGVAAPGLYQVSLSSPGWIDVVQDGKTLETQAHTGKSDCEGLRKSVRFNIGAGPFAVQINGAPNAEIKIAVRNAS